MRHAIIQTSVFRNINIFFSYSNVWFLHLHSTKNYTQTCRPAVHNCYDLGAAGGCRRGRRGRKGWVYFLSLKGWLYAQLAEGRRSVHHFFFLRFFHSTPPPIHGPSFSHSVAFSLDRHHVHAHTINYTLYFLSISLSFIHTLSRSLPRLFTPRCSSDILSFFFCLPPPPFNHLHSRAFMFVVLIFSNI